MDASEAYLATIPPRRTYLDSLILKKRVFLLRESRNSFPFFPVEPRGTP